MIPPFPSISPGVDPTGSIPCLTHPAPKPGYPGHGPHSSSSGLTWDLVRKAGSQAPSQPSQIHVCIFNKIFSWFVGTRWQCEKMEGGYDHVSGCRQPFFLQSTQRGPS